MVQIKSNVGLTIRGLSKMYGSHTVLRDVTLDVKEGAFLCIVGFSGCGKTTLLRVIAGFESYTGKVLHRGKPIEGPSPERFMVFQELNQLLPWKTVEANIRFGLVAGSPRDRVSARDLVNLVGLQGFESYYPHQLSGGMKQRVAIARALFMDPSVLLMDEPFGSLDARTRGKLGIELLRIWQAVRKTVVFVTHNIREAVQLADRVIVLSKHGTIQDDIPIVLSRPRGRDVTSHAFGVYWRRVLSSLGGDAYDQLIG